MNNLFLKAIKFNQFIVKIYKNISALWNYLEHQITAMNNLDQNIKEIKNNQFKSKSNISLLQDQKK